MALCKSGMAGKTSYFLNTLLHNSIECAQSEEQKPGRVTMLIMTYA